MRSGVFGANDYHLRRKKKQILRRTFERELGLGDKEQRRRNHDLLMQVRHESSSHAAQKFG